MIKIIRKSALVAGIFSCSMLHTHASEGGLKDWSFGIKGGFSNSGVWGEQKIKLNDNEIDAKILNPWFSGGLYVNYSFLEWIGAGIEVNYKRYGSKFIEKNSNTSNATNEEKKEKEGCIYTYNIDIPVGVSFYPMGREEEEGILGLHIKWIPSVVLLKRIKSKATSDQWQDRTETFKKSIKSYDLGNVGAGLSYELPFGLIISGDYYFGFMNMLESSQSNEIHSLKIEQDAILKKNWNIDLRIGYNFAKLL